jgi:hypothetical protein
MALLKPQAERYPTQPTGPVVPTGIRRRPKEPFVASICAFSTAARRAQTRRDLVFSVA